MDMSMSPQDVTIITTSGLTSSVVKISALNIEGLTNIVNIGRHCKMI